MKKKTIITLALVGGVSYLLYKRSQQPLGYFPGDDSLEGFSFSSAVKKISSIGKKASPKKFFDKGIKTTSGGAQGAIAAGRSSGGGGGKSFSQKIREAAAAKKAKKEAKKAARAAAAAAAIAAAAAAGQSAAQQQAAGNAAGTAAEARVEAQPDSYYTPSGFTDSAGGGSGGGRTSDEMIVRSTESNEYSDSSSAGSPGLPPIATTVETSAPEYETAVEAPAEESKGGAMLAGAGLAVAAAFAMLAK